MHWMCHPPTLRSSNMLIALCVTCILAHCNPPPHFPVCMGVFPPTSYTRWSDFLHGQYGRWWVPCGFLIYNTVYTPCQKVWFTGHWTGVYTCAHSIAITHTTRWSHLLRKRTHACADGISSARGNSNWKSKGLVIESIKYIFYLCKT